eukprot:1675640-Prymnesium_polylepis.1
MYRPFPIDVFTCEHVAHTWPAKRHRLKDCVPQNSVQPSQVKPSEVKNRYDTMRKGNLLDLTCDLDGHLVTKAEVSRRAGLSGSRTAAVAANHCLVCSTLISDSTFVKTSPFRIQRSKERDADGTTQGADALASLQESRRSREVCVCLTRLTWGRCRVSEAWFLRLTFDIFTSRCCQA